MITIVRFIFRLAAAMFVFSAMLVLSVGPALADETVLWPYFSFPPMVVLDEAGKPSGINITIQDMLFEALPQFEHQRIQSPFTRSMSNVKAGATYCFTGLLRTPEREQWLAYSLPCRLSAPNVILARKGEMQGLVRDGAASVAELLEQPGLRLGLVSGFRYGQGLDEIIASAQPDSVYHIHSLESAGHQIDLLLAGRIDWLITFPTQALYQARASGALDRLDFIPIAEPQEYIVGYVACTDNELGRQVIQGVDQVLADRVPTPAYREIFAGWVDQKQRATFMERYELLLAKPARAWQLQTDGN